MSFFLPVDRFGCIKVNNNEIDIVRIIHLQVTRDLQMQMYKYIIKNNLEIEYLTS